MTDPASVEAARGLVDHRTGGFGLDVLVNNAGFALPGPLETLAERDLRELFDTNVFGLLAVTRAFLPAMRERGRGRVVNVGSIKGRVAMPLLGAYNATKHAVAATTDVLRMQLAPFGITVVLVEPGTIRTAFAARALAAQVPFRNRLVVAALTGLPTGAADAAKRRIMGLRPPGT